MAKERDTLLLSCGELKKEASNLSFRLKDQEMSSGLASSSF